MKKIFILFISAIIVFAGCTKMKSQQDRSGEKAIATVGDTKITVAMFVKKVERERKFNPNLKLDDATRLRILNELIDFELLYQYALKTEVDRSDKVKKVLISNLLRKNIKSDKKVTDEVLENYFNQNKEKFNDGKTPPEFKNLKFRVRTAYLKENEKEKYNAYIQELKQKYHVIIYQEKVDQLLGSLNTK